MLARSELSDSERTALEHCFEKHLGLDIKTIQSLIDIAFRPEYRAVVDRHEVLSFGARFGEKLVDQMLGEQMELPTLTDFAERFGGEKDSTVAFGANVLGAVLGGLLEYTALLVGYRSLLFIVAAAYALAFISDVRRKSHDELKL